ncbi:hypothetical protein L4C42_18215 [Vibrio wakamikoensis]|jgi:hypothetical protein|uniref:IrrE N-terminal-like domain-containing protein n=1 Tax=Vibrio chaetopteri TaxID=3016528 RepID=A0AAU8BLM5_9VIBR
MRHHNHLTQSQNINDSLDKIVNFFNEIGISWSFGNVNSSTFLPGIEVKHGALVIDRQKLKHPGDLLHEAGHIAVTTRLKRLKFCGDAKSIGHKGGEEMAAIAWSWAALNYIGLSPEVVFHQQGYKGASESLIDAFENQGGFGHPLLSYWLMCEPQGTLGGYPKMSRWLREN